MGEEGTKAEPKPVEAGKVTLAGDSSNALKAADLTKFLGIAVLCICVVLWCWASVVQSLGLLAALPWQVPCP